MKVNLFLVMLALVGFGIKRWGLAVERRLKIDSVSVRGEFVVLEIGRNMAVGLDALRHSDLKIYNLNNKVYNSRNSVEMERLGSAFVLCGTNDIFVVSDKGERP